MTLAQVGAGGTRRGAPGCQRLRRAAEPGAGYTNACGIGIPQARVRRIDVSDYGTGVQASLVMQSKIFTSTNSPLSTLYWASLFLTFWFSSKSIGPEAPS